MGQDNNIVFRKFKSFDFYYFGDFGHKLVKMVKISKNLISGKVDYRLAPVCYTLTGGNDAFRTNTKAAEWKKRGRKHIFYNASPASFGIKVELAWWHIGNMERFLAHLLTILGEDVGHP